MFENIQLLKVDPREYFDDILGLIITGLGTNALIAVFASAFLPWYIVSIQQSEVFVNIISYVKSILPSNYDAFPISIVYIKIAFWLIAYLFLRKWLLLQMRPLLRKLSKEVLFENRYSLDLSKFEKEWEFQGNINLVEQGLEITNTPSGCLIKNDIWDRRVWENFSATFDVIFNLNLSLQNSYVDMDTYIHLGRYYKASKVELGKVLGIIFRAQNLDNYFMLGIMIVEKAIIFRPHVRVSGNLDIPLYNPPTNTFSLKTISNKPALKMLVKNNEVKVYIQQEGEWEKCFYWLLPTFYKTNLNEGGKTNDDSEFITRKVPFKNSPGMFGFRNYGNELAIVNSLQIYGRFSKEEEKLFNR